MHPDPEQTRRFCERWLEKGRQYDAKTLDGAFDKFFSLWVAFNRLYSHVCLHSGQKLVWDKKQATQQFPELVHAGRLLSALEENGGDADVRTLSELIGPNGQFYLIPDRTTRGPDRARNEDLHDRLLNPCPAIKVGAVLEYLYLVRCNMFHGLKDFDNQQILIIQPATRSLERIVRAGLRFIEDSRRGG